VDALFEKRDEIDPLFMIGGIKQEPVSLGGNFRSAFEYFDGRMLLLGEPGAGKTITLLHFGRDAVVQRIQNPAKPLPVLAIIPTWDAEKQTPLAEWLANAYGAPPDVGRIVAEGRTLLLLDGLDELGGERENPKTHERYDPRQRFIGVIPANNQVIVTCRVKDYEEIGEKIALKGAVTLQQLTDAQIRDYLSVEVPDLWAALEADEELRDVVRTPLLLSLFAFGYKDQGEEAAKLRDLRTSPVDLRDAIFRQYVTRRYKHEARKLRYRQPPETLPFTLEEIYEVLGRISAEYAIWYPSVDILFAREFVTILGKENARGFIELVLELNLVIPSGINLPGHDTYRFVHLLLREHFAFETLVIALGDEDWNVRCSAAEALGQRGNTRAIPALTVALSDRDSHVRAQIVESMGEIGIVAVESLNVALRDSDVLVCLSTITALAKIGNVRAVELLSTALCDNREFIRTYAAKALKQIGTPEALAAVEAWRREQNQEK
jgi:hypothetical protein